MKCEELQINLPLFIDDILSDNECSLLKEHLPRCPLCRQKLSEYRELRNDLRVISRPAVPFALLQNVKNAVSAKIGYSQPMFSPLFTESFAERIRHFIMPYSVATFASLLIVVSLFLLIDLQPDSNSLEVALFEQSETSSAVLLANSNTDKVRKNLSLDSDSFQGITLTDTPPSINPKGALVALTKSFVQGKMKDEEVVVVVDVFSNGTAKVSGVVEPPKDEQTMWEIQNALETNSVDASFLPAKADERSDKVTFIFKIQRVDVY